MLNQNIAWMRGEDRRVSVASPIPTISAWAKEAGIRISSGNAEPGPIDFSRAPYQTGIMDAFTPGNGVYEVVIVSGAQLGKTTIEMLVMLYHIVVSPCQMGFAFSDEGNLRSFIRTVFDPLLHENPSIREKFHTKGTAKADSMQQKLFRGGFIRFMSGRSTGDVRSASLRLVMMDEVEAMEVKGEGDILNLLRQRTSTFGNSRKMGISSTPINGGKMFTYLEQTTKRVYMMPCPECDNLMTYELDHLRWEDADPDAAKDGKMPVVREAWMECPHCHAKIRESKKQWMLERGKWIALNPNADPSKEGFWINTFYSPSGWVSWKTLAQEYAEASRGPLGIDPSRITTFYNTRLAREWVPGRNDGGWRALMKKAEDSPYHRGQIPEDVIFLTTGSDIQANRIETLLIGWGKFGQHWIIDHDTTLVQTGDPLESPYSTAWSEWREKWLSRLYTRVDGVDLPVSVCAIDSSYRPDDVYAFRRSLTPSEQARVIPVMGQRKEAQNAVLTPTERHPNKQDIFYAVATSGFKSMIFDHLSPDRPEDAPFQPHYSRGFSEEFYQQLFSEERVERKGRWDWVKIRDRNEILDCHVYNYAMFYHLGLNNTDGAEWDAVSEVLRSGHPLSTGPTVFSGGISV